MIKIGDPFFIVTQAVEAKIRQHGGVRPAARALGITAAYVSRLRYGDKREPNDALLAKLGLVREVRYRWKGKQ